MENNKQWSVLRVLLERNKEYKVKSGYDGSKILTQWDKFGDYKIQEKREKRMVKISWNLISLGEPIKYRKELMKKYNDSNEYLHHNKHQIINHWLTKHEGSDFLLTLLVMFLFFKNKLSLLEEYNIKYKNIFRDGEIKQNMKVKYGEIEKFLTLNETYAPPANLEFEQKNHKSPFSQNIEDLFVASQQQQKNSQKRNPKIDEKIRQSSEKNGDIAEKNTFNQMKMAIKNYEKCFYDLIGINEKDQIKIEDTFRQNSNAGYDILITKENEPHASFEVKSIISAQKGHFFISANELKHLQSNGFSKFLVLYKNEKDIRVLKAKTAIKHMEKKAASFKVTMRK